MKAEGVLLCGGGTGGHVLPGLAVAERLRAAGAGRLRWVGDPQRIEARLVPSAGIELLPFGLTRPRPLDPRWWWRTAGTVRACWREMRSRPPRAVVALGGYASLVPGLLAPLLRRPLVVMEQNARAGRTNRLLARGAARVVTQFAEAADGLPAHRVRLLGNPVRPIAARRRGLGPDLTVLVVGGSLAAKSLNDLVALAAPQLRAIPGLRLVHLAGEEDRGRIAGIYAEAGLAAEVHGFVADMPSLYERIDLAVTRAGATTVAELCSAGIGALYIPLPWAADDHQTANAAAVAQAGGAVLLPQAGARPEHIAMQLARLAADRPAVEAMGAAAARLARPRAASQVASLVLGLAGRRARRAARRAAVRRIPQSPAIDVR